LDDALSRAWHASENWEGGTHDEDYDLEEGGFEFAEGIKDVRDCRMFAMKGAKVM
jgi:hypothetical protein